MNKSELCDAIASHANLNKAQAGQAWRVSSAPLKAP